MEYVLLIFIFLFGTVIGSFLNVCIHRIPKGLSIAYPPSYCPKCGQRIKPYDLIPVVSYAILGGKCRHCKEPISIRYPIVEALTGIAFVVSALTYGYSIELLYSLALVSSLMIISFVDIDEGIILDAALIPIVAVGIIAVAVDPSGTWQYAALGALVGACIIGTIYILSLIILKKEGMGIGDIKLMAAVGTLLGWQRTLLAFFIGVYIGAIAGIIMIALKKKDMASEIPFGPFLSIGTAISWWFGYEFINWYLFLA
ncbi:prepilin peptidase [Mahella australiensis]|uniref:Prepilin leader peptidase/N-methyltransferase n=1 Tax=Mahella australiensis (strain DSM 15567 / CIP 107919 / 50-1 BON) TaxID=697281 RepID=F3ZVG9_MAHA5|nr:A24 family peptidase [Mahella australiensis]AEE96331.1 Prepilin peptidase [Mahella australiensis 50-1 BON]